MLLKMALLEVYDNRSNNEIILNTPNRNEILKEGPPQNSKCNILGRGAYGTVFKAVFRAKQVAVKIIKNLKDVNLQTMHNEANILGWEHRNIVKVLKIESTPNFGIVIMERFLGQCLQSILDSVTLPLEHRVFISLDIVSALAYCHKRKLLHLDVKPQNVLVSLERGFNNAHKQNISLPKRRSYVCKLCDFGSSMRVLAAQDNTALKEAGMARGTVRYMSPEALREERLTPSSDIYSLGITMWQLQHRCLPYSWIECNEVVAYQVVKHNLRPDFDATGLPNQIREEPSSAQPHRNCYCEQYVSEMSYLCLKQIRDFLNQNELAEGDMLHFSKWQSRRRSEALGSRLPLHLLNSKKSEATVVRDLRAELDSIKTLECGVDSNLMALLKWTHSVASPHKENAYEALFKSCWQADARLRPNSVKLRKLLKQLI